MSYTRMIDEKYVCTLGLWFRDNFSIRSPRLREYEAVSFAFGVCSNNRQAYNSVNNITESVPVRKRFWSALAGQMDEVEQGQYHKKLTPQEITNLVLVVDNCCFNSPGYNNIKLTDDTHTRGKLGLMKTLSLELSGVDEWKAIDKSLGDNTFTDSKNSFDVFDERVLSSREVFSEYDNIKEMLPVEIIANVFSHYNNYEGKGFDKISKLIEDRDIEQDDWKSRDMSVGR